MRELSLRLLLAWLAAIILTGLFAVVARAIQLDEIGQFDEPIINAVQGVETPWLTAVMKTFTIIGSTTVVLMLVITVISWLIIKKRYSQAAFVAIVIAGTAVINQVLKFIFQRQRPDFHRLIDISGYSFPSGHTMMAFSLYTVLAYILWRSVKTAAGQTAVIIAAAVMVAMIALSRIYLGVHFPSDIVGGILISAAWIIAAIAVYGRFQRMKAEHFKRTD